MRNVIFFDTTILIAASIREIESAPSPIEHKFYDGSQGLIRMSPKGKVIGITSYTVEEQAENKLAKALKDTILECVGNLKLVDKDYKTYSIILDKVERNFRENIRLLDRLATNLVRVRNIKTQEVFPMYSELAGDRPSKAWTFTPKLKQVAKQVTKIQWGRYLDGLKWKGLIPDETDMEILSEAIYLKRERFSQHIFFLVSSDKHFSGSSKEPWNIIPKRIKTQFQIFCNYPNEIINLI